MKLHVWNSAFQCTILLLFVFYKKFSGGGGGVPPDLPCRLGASRRRSSDNTDKICSGLAPLYKRCSTTTDDHAVCPLQCTWAAPLWVPLPGGSCCTTRAPSLPSSPPLPSFPTAYISARIQALFHCHWRPCCLSTTVYVGCATVGAAAWWFMLYDKGPLPSPPHPSFPTAPLYKRCSTTTDDHAVCPLQCTWAAPLWVPLPGGSCCTTRAPSLPSSPPLPSFPTAYISARIQALFHRHWRPCCLSTTVYVGCATMGAAAWWFMLYDQGPLPSPPHPSFPTAYISARIQALFHHHWRPCCLSTTVYVGCATVGAAAWWFMLYDKGPRLNYYQLVRHTLSASPAHPCSAGSGREGYCPVLHCCACWLESLEICYSRGVCVGTRCFGV